MHYRETDGDDDCPIFRNHTETDPGFVIQEIDCWQCQLFLLSPLSLASSICRKILSGVEKGIGKLGSSRLNSKVKSHNLGHILMTVASATSLTQEMCIYESCSCAIKFPSAFRNHLVPLPHRSLHSDSFRARYTTTAFLPLAYVFRPRLPHRYRRSEQYSPHQ